MSKYEIPVSMSNGYHSVNGIPESKLREIADILGVIDTVILIIPLHVVKDIGKCYTGINQRIIELACEIPAEQYRNKYFKGEKDEVTVGWLVALHEFFHALHHIGIIKPDDPDSMKAWERAKDREALISGEKTPTEVQKVYLEGYKERMSEKEDEADRFAVDTYHDLKNKGLI